MQCIYTGFVFACFVDFLKATQGLTARILSLKREKVLLQRHCNSSSSGIKQEHICS